MRGVILLCFLGMFFHGTSVSAGISIEDVREGRYFERRVRAQHVARVEVILVKEIVREDCNRRSLVPSSVLAFGDGKGFGDTYFIEAKITQTKMHCPMQEPVAEMIRAKVTDFVPDAAACIDGQVDVTLIVPEGVEISEMILDPLRQVP